MTPLRKEQQVDKLAPDLGGERTTAQTLVYARELIDAKQKGIP